MRLVSPKIRKWVFGISIGINTLLFPFSLAVIQNNNMAVLNVASALLCWLGFFIADKELEENLKGDD